MNIIITGATSGIWLATARLLAEKWHSVIATGRNVSSPTFTHKNISWYSLDLASADSRANFWKSVSADFPIIDGLVNNAGYGLVSAFEWATEEEIRAQFDTNYFGTVELTKLVLAKMLAQDRGNIVTVTSIGGKMSFPFYGYYNGTKHALEWTFESLWFETQNTRVRIKIVEPWFTRTDFVSRSQKTWSVIVPRLQKAFEKLLGRLSKSEAGSTPDVIAKVIVRALLDRSSRLRYSAGYLSELIFLRRILPESLFRSIVGSNTIKNDSR